MNATVERAPRTPAAETAGAAGGPTRAPARRPGTPGGEPSRAGDNVWLPVVAKAAGILLGMLALAGIGAASIASGAGVPVPVAAAAASNVTPAATATPAAAGTSAVPPPTPARAPAAPRTAAASGSGITADGRVILNLASADELTRLPKVGAKRAEAIVLLRARLGKYRKATDLLRVKGIGKKTLEGMLPLLVVDPPPGPSAGGDPPSER